MRRQLLTTAEVAMIVKFSEDWVREHAAELGGIRTGRSKRSQLRFEPESIDEWRRRQRLSAPLEEGQISQRPGPRQAPAGVALLPLPASR
jgi:hypothetical protein